MRKLAEFIVRKRWLFAAVFVALIVYSIISIPRVKVEYDISAYLPEETDTKQALEIMDDEFASYGTATVMVKDISYADAEALRTRISALDGVNYFPFGNSDGYYKDGVAKFSVTFAGAADDERSAAAYADMLKILDASGYKYSVPSPLVESYADTLASEMVIILAIAAAVIILVLLFTSKSFAEVIAFPIVFITAAVVNMGTNHWLGTISFVSNTVCIVLQLALAIDYAIILCHRFTEEKEKAPGNAQAALISALAKAIPEIASSSLTTVSGLVALMFMQLRLGYDLGMVLAKSIIISLLTVFFLMPAILLPLSKIMDKTRHRSFVPKIRFWGRGVVKLRYVVIAAFVALFATGSALVGRIDYVYSTSDIDTSKPTATVAAKTEMQEIFGYSNMFVVLVPKGDEERERLILETVSREELVDSALGLAGISLVGASGRTYYLHDYLTVSEFGDMTGMGTGVAQLIYGMYANRIGESEPDFSVFKARAIDVIDYVIYETSLAKLSPELAAVAETLKYAESQLIGTAHDRLIFNIAADTEAPETFALIERLMPKVKEICPEAIFAGESMSAYDLNESFSSDNILITLLTIAFIFVILAVTFKSWGIPVVLVLVIQGAIFINFSLPVITGRNLFFFVYLIASAIQMGATIDYAILLTNRFRSLKTLAPDRRAAVSEAVSESFPTILTSGTIMSVAAFLVGLLTSDPLISSMGMMLGSGTLISIACVMTALPALLYTLDPLLEKTVVKFKKRARKMHMPNPSAIPFCDSGDD